MTKQNKQKEIVKFLGETFDKTGKTRAVIGLSGGIDSATSFFLLRKVLPIENINAVYMPYNLSKAKISSSAYSDGEPTEVEQRVSRMCRKSGLPTQNFLSIPIKGMVDQLARGLKTDDKARKGNIMARVRMIILFDLAKKFDALVCGTENKSEHHLGYFTRFGDEASDIEPIRHLYKSQIRELAKELGVPQEVLDAVPTAGLWDGQTDEGQFGFTYKEADQILKAFFEGESLKSLQARLPNAKKILKLMKANEFKHLVPYALEG